METVPGQRILVVGSVVRHDVGFQPRGRGEIDCLLKHGGRRAREQRSYASEEELDLGRRRLVVGRLGFSDKGRGGCRWARGSVRPSVFRHASEIAEGARKKKTEGKVVIFGDTFSRVGGLKAEDGDGAASAEPPPSRAVPSGPSSGSRSGRSWLGLADTHQSTAMRPSNPPIPPHLLPDFYMLIGQPCQEPYESRGPRAAVGHLSMDRPHEPPSSAPTLCDFPAVSAPAPGSEPAGYRTNSVGGTIEGSPAGSPATSAASGRSASPQLPSRVLKLVADSAAQASEDHRGTPEAPGRVVTLIERSYWEQLTDHHDSAPDRVWGVAYRIKPDKVAEVKQYLDIREINGYSIHYAPFQPADGAAAIPALVYIGTPDNEQFVGPQDPQDLAEHIFRSQGPSGLNRDYLLELDAALDDLAVDSGDVHVGDLARRVRLLVRASRDSEAVLDTIPADHEFRKVKSTNEAEEIEKGSSSRGKGSLEA
ncbi:hypothetical protein G7046_g8415 [Stylonectria norvegica]|nr:hypothetical protein G7046_g8415 [Stylonectria norvegica]